mmetsp:Transcript_116910/g.342359  ORF Transcript_116910/g.342359 Transcript_116910/m.342359 type:complete len:246 (+) Transcript_116910:95-832(+)
MVYFECQKCNETIKKPKLAKHLQFCNSGYVSCIDCSKVFAWNEWESHTSCVSEAQKYQGNLYQAKENSNKGQQKQDAWVDNVEKCIEDPNSSIPPQTKQLLRKLLGFSNIPRKQKPFANFVKNSLKIWDDGKINELWAAIAAAIAPPKKAAEPAKEAPAAAPAKAPEGPKAGRWAGWKRALDEELDQAGGSLPWKKLRDVLATRCLAEGGAGDASAEHLGHQALAAIPEAYLSEEDSLVRLPAGR